MPVYCYRCPSCGRADERVRPMRESEASLDCDCGGAMLRDFAAEGVKTDLPYANEQVSVAAGVHPDQVAECREANPHHKFNSDGDMLFTSHRHRERCLKDLCMHDNRR